MVKTIPSGSPTASSGPSGLILDASRSRTYALPRTVLLGVESCASPPQSNCCSCCPSQGYSPIRHMRWIRGNSSANSHTPHGPRRTASPDLFNPWFRPVMDTCGWGLPQDFIDSMVFISCFGNPVSASRFLLIPCLPYSSRVTVPFGSGLAPAASVGSAPGTSRSILRETVFQAAEFPLSPRTSLEQYGREDNMDSASSRRMSGST